MGRLIHFSVVRFFLDSFAITFTNFGIAHHHLPGPEHIGRDLGRNIWVHQSWCIVPPRQCGTLHRTTSLCSATSCSRKHCKQRSLSWSKVQKWPIKTHVCNYFTRCCSLQRWFVPMHAACCYGNRGTVPVRCSLCGDVPENIQLISFFLSWQTYMQRKDAEAPTKPGGHKQPGMHARLTQGRSMFWHVLAHSRPLPPWLQSAWTSGGGHWADLRSMYIKKSNQMIKYKNYKVFLTKNQSISKMTKFNSVIMFFHLRVKPWTRNMVIKKYFVF